MFAMFTGGQGELSWPKEKVVSALETHYGSIRMLAEEGPLAAYGVADNGVNFVVALMETAPGSGRLAEIGFFARFIGFNVDERAVEALNRNLHISLASVENGGELYLMAGLQVAGAFDLSQFALILETWRRDLMMTMHRVSEGASMAAAFPAARLEAARDFAVNAAPAPVDDRPVDMLARFLGGAEKRTLCGECNGRGKRGFIARVCNACDGAGFVNAR